MMLLLPSLLCALAGYVSAFSVETSNSKDLYPPLWEEIPGQLSDYTAVNGVYVIDAWLYPTRMSLYKILITSTKKYFERFSQNNEKNILFGLPLQHGWQFKTGRLADPTKATDCGREGEPMCISVDSWWARANYYLCALPFLAAVEAGIIEVPTNQVILSPPLKDQKYFCYDVASCQSFLPNVMAKWNTFYQQMKEPSESLEDLLKYLWDVHDATIDVIAENLGDGYKIFPKPEADFAKSWVTAVHYIAAMLFETSLNKTYEFQKTLPPRMLQENDKAPLIKDFTASQNKIVYYLGFLDKVDTFSNQKSLTLFRILMKSQKLRKLVNAFLERIIKDKNLTPREMETFFQKVIRSSKFIS
uniref:Protein LEG1 homolog n=1 Tax=Monodelphis domestica TaxID=13616 RepID=F7GG02_MONDO